MKEKIKNPIYYCTGIDREEVNLERHDIEDYMGEYEENISFTFLEMKTNTETEETIRHHEPYWPASIESIDISNIVNLTGTDGSNYNRNPFPFLEDYQRGLQELVDLGIPLEDITASQLKEHLKDLTLETGKGKTI